MKKLMLFLALLCAITFGNSFGLRSSKYDLEKTPGCMYKLRLRYLAHRNRQLMPTKNSSDDKFDRKQTQRADFYRENLPDNKGQCPYNCCMIATSAIVMTTVVIFLKIVL